MYSDFEQAVSCKVEKNIFLNFVEVFTFANRRPYLKTETVLLKSAISLNFGSCAASSVAHWPRAVLSKGREKLQPCTGASPTETSLASVASNSLTVARINEGWVITASKDHGPWFSCMSWASRKLVHLYQLLRQMRFSN